jgi:ribosomal protein S18 acetylase RimI-like enzyme
MNARTQLYEELTLNAHPSLQTQLFDGWVLRFSNGYSYRANSVNMLYASTLDLPAKVLECERRYHAHGLPAVFKLTDEADPALAQHLTRQGYRAMMPTHVMTAPLTRDYPAKHTFVAAPYADEAWNDAYFAFSAYDNPLHVRTARQMMACVKNPAVFGRIILDNQTVACGSAVVERGCAALLNIVTHPQLRGRGYGKAVCQALLNRARQAGAHTAYLQVMQDNQAAIGLYRQLGYTPIYDYYYLSKEQPA